ncbi:MAG: hypothetical protein N2445_08810, partial [Acidobacteria bacterium]|nr:hypothetical protein [Acidobacteriota bacterium]
MFFKIAYDLKQSAERTEKEVFEQSYEIVSRMKIATPQNFSFPMNKSEIVIPKAAGWFLGPNKIWTYPNDFVFPQFVEPKAPAGEIVSVSSGKKMFLSRVEDGRTAVILFETPEYKRVWSQSVITSFLAFSVGAFGIFLLLATIKKFKSQSIFSEEHTQQMKSQENPVDAIVILKKAMADLQEKNLFLESELRKEKKKAKGVSSVLENLSSTLNAGFIRFDSQGNLQSFNPVAKNLIGLPILFRTGENFRKMFIKNAPLLQFIENSIEKREILT